MMEKTKKSSSGTQANAVLKVSYIIALAKNQM